MQIFEESQNEHEIPFASSMKECEFQLNQKNTSKLRHKQQNELQNLWLTEAYALLHFTATAFLKLKPL